MKKQSMVLALLVIFSMLMAMATSAYAQRKGPANFNKKSGAAAAEEEDDDEEDPDAERGGEGIELGEENQTLEREDIMRVISGRYKGITACYEKALLTNKTLKGRVLVNFSIDLKGDVKKPKIVKKKSSLKDKKVRKCIIEIVEKLRFPERKKGEVIEINYPFNFVPKDK